MKSRMGESINHIIAPPDGRLVAAADSTAVSWAGTVGRPTIDASQVCHALLNAVGRAFRPAATTRKKIHIKNSLVQAIAFFGDIAEIIGVPVRVLLKKFVANFLNRAVERDYRPSWIHFNFPLRKPDPVAVQRSRESRGPRLRRLVSTYYSRSKYRR